MFIQVSKPDILGILKVVGRATGNEVILSSYPLLSSYVDIDNSIQVKKELLLGKAQVSFTLKACEGCIEIDISSVSVFGLSIISLVRAKAAQIIMQVLKPYEPMFYVFKHRNGNLRVNVPRVYFQSAEVRNGLINLNLDIGKI